MGLDMIEIVMAVEDRFGIQISEDEASQCETVGKYYELIKSKVRSRPLVESCSEQRVFYRLRRALVNLTAWPRKMIRPNMPVSALSENETLKTLWERLEEQTKWVFPKLEPGISGKGLMIFAFWVILVVISIALLFYGYIKAGFCLAALCVLMGIYRKRFSYRNASYSVPSHCRTLGDLSKALVELNHRVNDRQIWSDLCQIIADILGLEPSELKPESHFVRDLNAG